MGSSSTFIFFFFLGWYLTDTNASKELYTFLNVRHSQSVCCIDGSVFSTRVFSLFLGSFPLLNPYLVLAPHQPGQDGYQVQRMGRSGGSTGRGGRRILCGETINCLMISLNKILFIPTRFSSSYGPIILALVEVWLAFLTNFLALLMKTDFSP